MTVLEIVTIQMKNTGKKIAIIRNRKRQSEEVFQTLMQKLRKAGFILTPKNPDIVISVGGDGMLLSAFHKYEEQLDKVRFVGVHTGHLGFYTDYRDFEIEYKTMLTEDEHKRLLTFFDHVQPIFQVNYYIDSADFALREARMALRVRTTPDAAEFTLKIPQKLGNFEYNQALSEDEFKEITENLQFPQGEILDKLQEKGIPVDKLTILGTLENIRYEKQDALGLFALDESRYFGKKDFELELEINDIEEGEQKFKDFLNENQIQYKPDKSKIARFAENL